jgi:hypothetical protein
VRVRLARLVLGGLVVALVTSAAYVSVSPTSAVALVAFLTRPLVASAYVPKHVAPVAQAAQALLPSPKPTPPPAAPTYQSLQDCTQVVLHSLTAFAVGTRQVKLTWSASGACTPVHGWIGASYFSSGGNRSWTDYITAESGSLIDTVPALPGSPSYPCSVDVSYMLSIGGSAAVLQGMANGVYICGN